MSAPRTAPAARPGQYRIRSRAFSRVGSRRVGRVGLEPRGGRPPGATCSKTSKLQGVSAFMAARTA